MKVIRTRSVFAKYLGPTDYKGTRWLVRWVDSRDATEMRYYPRRYEKASEEDAIDYAVKYAREMVPSLETTLDLTEVYVTGKYDGYIVTFHFEPKKQRGVKWKF